MKIGIVTFYDIFNYGAVLQVYGLKEYMQSLGHEVNVVDFSYISDRSKNNIIKRSKQILGYVINTRRALRRMRFRTFVKRNFNLDYAFLDEKENDYDALIFGSDQIWNPNLTGGQFNPFFIGEFPAAEKKRKIAYAASSKIYSFTQEQEKKFKNSVSKFVAISVREQAFSEKLSSLFNLDVPVVLDPTLLVGTSVFNKLCVGEKLSYPYILVYDMTNDLNVCRIAESLSTQLSMRVVKITPNKIQFLAGKGDKTTISPEKFALYMKYAACVVTTSFHGTAFAILNERPFYTLKMGNDLDGRSQSILGKIGLLDRFIDKESTPIFSVIDYEVTNEKLKHLRSLSEEFLINALNK